MDTVNSRGKRAFSPALLLDVLSRLPRTERFLIGYSGGCDSTVLVHAMATVRERLAPIDVLAVHIDHGLHRDSVSWARHCLATCNTLGMPCVTQRVDVTAVVRGQTGLEAAAREVRYAALQALMKAGDILLTAHHQDDQAETLVLQLLRGAGAAGLAAMPVLRPFGRGLLARPLLSFSRLALRDYASRYDLYWVEDPSNLDLAYDRNYVRHTVMEPLRQRWPRVSAVFERVARQQAEFAALADALAASDILTCRIEGGGVNTLSVAALRRLPVTRCRNVLRHWLKSLRLSVPTVSQMERVINDALGADEDRTPHVRWPGTELRRYRDALYAMPPQSPHDASQVIIWNIDRPLTLPSELGVLEAVKVEGRGISHEILNGRNMIVRFRRGGETIHPSGRRENHVLKKLFQERGIPPWERSCIPLVYLEGKLIAVADYWLDASVVASEGQVGWVLTWRRDLIDDPRQSRFAGDGLAAS